MDNKDFNYSRLRFKSLADSHAVYVNNGTVRQTNVINGVINEIFEFTYIYSADGTPRKIPANHLVSMYFTDGQLTSNRTIDTAGYTFSIKGLVETMNNFENYNIMLMDANGKMSVADAKHFKNNVKIKTEW